MKKKKKSKTNGVETNGEQSAVLSQDTATAAAQLPAGENMKVKRELIAPDPGQPRKTFDEEALAELAESIRRQGILQPLILEVIPAKFSVHEPDLNHEQWFVINLETGAEEFHGPEGQAKWFNHKDEYRIVCGERRYRAAKIAAVDELPAVVYRGLTAQQRFAMQWIENEQRENITALEEAEALQKQLADRKATDTTFSPEKLGAELGMSRAGVYEKLKLTRLHAPVRQALLDGKISASVAGVVAIVPLPNQQEKLLTKLTNEQDWHFPFSVRDVQEMVEIEYVKQLKDAPFEMGTAFLWTSKYPEEVMVRGEGCVVTCEACPFRTGNMVEQFPELAKRPNACTRPDCFGQKCKGHWQQAAVSAADKGKTVLTQSEFNKVKSKYAAGTMSVHAQNLSWGADLEKAMGKHKPEPVLVATAKGLEKFYPKEEAIAAARKNGTKFYDRTEEKCETPEQKAKREAKEADAKARGERMEAYLETQWPELAKLLPKLKSDVAWEIAALLLDEADGYVNHDALDAMEDKAKTPMAKVLARLFADSGKDPVVGHNDGIWNNDESVFESWNLAGIDLKAGFEASEKEAQGKLALPKKGPEQGELVKVKKNKKKK